MKLFSKLKNIIDQQPIFNLVTALIIFVSAVYGYDNQVFTFFSMSMLVLYLMQRDLATRPYYWIGFIILFVPIMIGGWEFVGNQKFIHFYVLIFILLASIYKAHQDLILKYGSYLIIFIIFAGASLWKFSVTDFRSGNFLEFAFLSGNIFDFYAVVADSLSIHPEKWKATYDTILNVNREAIYALQMGEQEAQVELVTNDNIILFSKLATILSLMTQAGIVLSFILYLIAKKEIWAVIMHGLICEFIILAYYPTQVIGFGILLCIVGLLNSHFNAKKYKPVYIGLIFVLMLYELPLHQWLMGRELNYVTGF